MASNSASCRNKPQDGHTRLREWVPAFRSYVTAAIALYSGWIEFTMCLTTIQGACSKFTVNTTREVGQGPQTR